MPTSAAVGRTFVELANGLTHAHPLDVPQLAGRCSTIIGGQQLELLLVDLEQRTLRPWGAAVTDAVLVDEVGPGPGSAYRREALEVVDVPGEPDVVRLWMPLMDSAQRVGVLGVTVATDDWDAATWTAFASVVGETLVSKTAYGDDIALTRRTGPVSLAAEMRWSMLPPLTFSSPHVEVSGLLEPAYDIAGDTFDYAVQGDWVDVAILDAMGHGLEASQIATLALGAYRRGRRQKLGLGQILLEIDEVVAAHFGDHRYVTGQLGRLNLASGSLTLVNAGHPRPAMFRDRLDAGDLECRPCRPLGLGGVRTEESDFEMRAGDAVIFYTDGVTEARGGGRQFGRKALGESVARSLSDGDRPAEVLRQLIRALGSHTQGGPLQDDATAIYLGLP